jgi:hypothetical protein
MAVFFDSPPDLLTTEVVAGLDDEQLWQVIYDNLHPGKDTPGAWEALLAPEVVDRVRRLLTARQVDIEHQLAERGAELEDFRHQCWEAGPAGRQPWFDREPSTTAGAAARSGGQAVNRPRLQAAKATAAAKVEDPGVGRGRQLG